MQELMSWDKLRKDVDLEGVTTALVSCRQPNGTTGPTFKYGITVRHPRQGRTSAFTMGMVESHITGIQTDPCSQYMQVTRATHETIVYLHDFPCGTPWDKVQWQAGEVPPQLQTRLARMIHHRDFAGDYDWIAVDCDKKGAPMPVFVNRTGQTHVIWAPWLPRQLSGRWTIGVMVSPPLRAWATRATSPMCSATSPQASW